MQTEISSLQQKRIQTLCHSDFSYNLCRLLVRLQAIHTMSMLAWAKHLTRQMREPAHHSYSHNLKHKCSMDFKLKPYLVMEGLEKI